MVDQFIYRFFLVTFINCHDVRKTVGTSQTDLMKFLRKYSNDFKVDKKGIISLLSSSSINPSLQFSLQKHDNRSNVSSQITLHASKKNDSLPDTINDGEGVIYKLHPKFGFMSIINPEIRETVYFTGEHFGQEESSILSYFNLQNEQVLYFNAVKASSNYEAKYRATKVWMPKCSRKESYDNSESRTYNGKNKTNNEQRHSYDNSKIKTYDNQRQSYNLKDKLFDNPKDSPYDNLKAKPYDNSKVKPYDNPKYKSYDNSKDKPYDIPKGKPYDNPKKENYNNSLTNPRKTCETGLYDPMTLEGEGFIQNVFPKNGFIEVNGDPESTVFFYLTKLCKYENLIDLTKVLKIGDQVEFSAIRSTKKNIKVRWEATKVWKKKNSNLKLSSKNSDEKIYNNDKNRLVNEEGKICIKSSGVTIKFGDSEQADADSCPFYMFETIVTDTAWEFSDCDVVNFDAIRTKSTSEWKAVLVWVGKKPNVEITDFSEEFIDKETDMISENFTYDSLGTNDSKLYSAKDSGSSEFGEFVHECLPGFKKSSSLKTVLPAFNESCCSKSNVSLNSDFPRSQKWEFRAGSHSSRESSHTRSSPESSADYRPRSRSRESSDSSKMSNASSGKPKGLGKHIQSGLETSCVYGGFSNWGDSPYPGEEVSDLVNKKTNLDCNIEIENKELKLTNNLVLKEKDPFVIDSALQINNKNQSIWKNERELSSTIEALFNYESCEDENSDNSSNYNMLESHARKSDAIQNFTKKHQKLRQNKKNPEIDNKVNLTKGAEVSKIKSYIKNFKDISGTIIKVYTRFAEINCDLLYKPVAFYLSDFYRNGVSVDAHFDDLKEVLKVCDKITFDCFEIMDDDGACWQKVTVAWKGKKPEVENVLSPEKFIEEKELKVTTEYDALQKRVRKANNKQQFLAENDDDSNEIVTLQTLNLRSHNDNALQHITTENITENMFPEVNTNLKTDSILNFENIMNEVTEIFKRRGFEDSDLLEDACSEIINFLHTFDQGLTTSFMPESSNQTESSKTSQAVQTIITGDVVIANIFPH